MIQKTVTARKSHTCDTCSKEIKKGQKYEIQQHRVPRFDVFDPYTGSYEKQVGVEFLTYKSCISCLDSLYLPQCGIYPCEFIPERNMDDNGVPTGREVCVNCGTIKTPAQ